MKIISDYKELAGRTFNTIRECAEEEAKIDAQRAETAEKNLSKQRKEFADAIGKRPSEVTKWLSGQHNFTLRTLAMLSTFFGESLVEVKR